MIQHRFELEHSRRVKDSPLAQFARSKLAINGEYLLSDFLITSNERLHRERGILRMKMLDELAEHRFAECYQRLAPYHRSGRSQNAANDLFAEQVTEVLDFDRSRTVLLDFVDNPYHGTYDEEEGELY